MSVTLDQLNDFHRFALVKLSNGGAESIADLVREWQSAGRGKEVRHALRATSAAERFTFKPILIRGAALSSTVLAERR